MTESITRSNPLNTAIQGIQRADAAVGKAVEAIVRIQVAAHNAANDRIQISDEAQVAAANQQAVLPSNESTDDIPLPVADSNTDITQPIVDLALAKVAYLASLKAVQVTADVLSDAANLKRLV